MLAGAIAALAMACGSSGGGSDPDAGPGDDDPDGGADQTSLDCVRRSGSRIRQVERVHSDDSDELLRLYDTELMVPCVYGVGSDGSMRCLPQADGAPFAAGQVFYEAGCTNRIARLDDPLGADFPDYMRYTAVSNDGCEARTGYVELGNQLSQPADSNVYTGTPESCVAQLAGTNPYFQITGDLTPEDLVEGTASWTDSGRIKLQQIDGADGSRVCAGAMIDEDLGDHPCQLAQAEDGATRCLPLSASIDEGFSNTGCTMPVTFALLDSTCGAPNRYVFESTGGECPRTRVRALLEELDAVYQLGDTCDAIALDADQALYANGPAVSGTSFAAFEVAYKAPGDRLERAELTDGAGLRLETTQWRDPSLDDAGCTFQVADDGLERCLPNDSATSTLAGVTIRYSDSGCLNEVRVGVQDLSCGRPEPKYASEPAAEEGTVVYQSMGTYPDDLFETPGACALVAEPGIYTQLSDALPAAMFVSGTEMIE